MCQAVIYLNDHEIMRDVIRVEPLPDGVRLTTFFEPPRIVPAVVIREIDLLKHRVMLEPFIGEETAMKDLEKLRVLLPHWIEHNAEHANELRSWADSMQHSGKVDVAERLFAAVASLQKASDQLSRLLEEASGVAGHDGRQEHL
jgi:predicted RNA-binding protein